MLQFFLSTEVTNAAVNVAFTKDALVILGVLQGSAPCVIAVFTLALVPVDAQRVWDTVTYSPVRVQHAAIQCPVAHLLPWTCFYADLKRVTGVSFVAENLVV